MFDSMILCQYDDNLSPVHSLYFIVWKNNYDILSYVSFYLTIFKIWIPNLTSFQHPILATIPNSIPKNLRKQAVLDVGDLVLRKDSTPSAAGGATPVDATALGSEVFQALQVTASEAWGEGILGPKKGEVFFWLDMKQEGSVMKNYFRFFFWGGSKKKWNMYVYVFFICNDLDFGVWTLLQ